ncbi:class I SAM-dependent methyltransferase [Clostridium sp. JS66]|uniref:class I SAM-dependent methyltransferase n=1 Tax=Clostridium sp. JS66 TaxID=3064705 RepID=UPI00298DFDF5|nr:class I SAM-dependent methyltransferase [Clostridium sp. JS66]WPC41040.1 class I SAM-dependent methyltransferase [Clostridium sp. JS66]
MEFKQEEWNNSYKSKDNFVFYPHEEVIRFISKYIKKRVGINKFVTISDARKCLDLGCGIGRHVIYLDENNFEAYGIDLSDEAINFAKEWCEKLKKYELKNRIKVGTITDMPYEDGYFDFVVSHGVLDSMPFDIAGKAVEETHRVIKNEGLFYFDVVSGCDYEHFREYDGEEVVNTQHENGTTQSYFNWNKIELLIQDKFKIKEAILIQRESVISRSKNSRYHIIAEKI